MAPLHARIPDFYRLKPQGAEDGIGREASSRFSREPGPVRRLAVLAPRLAPAISGHPR